MELPARKVKGYVTLQYLIWARLSPRQEVWGGCDVSAHTRTGRAKCCRSPTQLGKLFTTVVTLTKRPLLTGRGGEKAEARKLCSNFV